MQLKDLVGLHVLDAVDNESRKFHSYSEIYEWCDTIRFRLDGIVYMAVEDATDGYRSCMKNIESGNWEMKNVFTPIHVIARHVTEGPYCRDDDILELIDINTEKVVLRIGTENYNDYYPCCILYFDPTAMVTNTNK